LAGGPHEVSIDPNGNLTQKTEGSDTWTYSWNAENQLKRVLLNGNEVARFSYDPRGRRVEKIAQGVTTSYTYDGSNILREIRGAISMRYVGQGIDQPFAVEEGGSLSYFHTDSLGSVVGVTNPSGAVTLTRRYDAWGSPEVAPAQPGYAFTGREWDPEVGLYYYRARYYDAKIGRFISEDPLSRRQPQEVRNLYRYATNNPVLWRDPSGLIAWKCSVGLLTYGTFPVAAGIRADCTSECVGGAQLHQTLYGVGTGVSLGLPASASYAEFTLHDPYSSPNPWSLPGFWSYAGVAVAGGAMGYAYGSLTLGAATSLPSDDWEVGIDLAVDAFSGTTVKLSEQWETCQCK
jgi:RHS repeat-associated protein